MTGMERRLSRKDSIPTRSAHGVRSARAALEGSKTSEARSVQVVDDRRPTYSRRCSVQRLVAVQGLDAVRSATRVMSQLAETTSRRASTYRFWKPAKVQRGRSTSLRS